MRGGVRTGYQHDQDRAKAEGLEEGERNDEQAAEGYTVSPLKSTVRPAVAPARSITAYLSSPRAISSQNRDMISSE